MVLIEDIIQAVLTVLYLPGFQNSRSFSKRSWPDVVRAIRTHHLLSPADALTKVQLHAEAACLQNEQTLAEALRLVAANSAITAVSPHYPKRWLSVLGAGAPPALWSAGQPFSQPTISIVGGRSVSAHDSAFSRDVSSEVVRLGYAVCSGGAKGCDNAAEVGALSSDGKVLRIVPHGLGSSSDSSGAWVLSACHPEASFSAAAAMHRNLLIYAASDAAVVCRARFKEGGTWAGATEALRRRCTKVIVQDDESSLAHRSLRSLGAVSLSSPSDLALCLQNPGVQAALFALG